MTDHIEKDITNRDLKDLIDATKSDLKDLIIDKTKETTDLIDALAIATEALEFGSF